MIFTIFKPILKFVLFSKIDDFKEASVPAGKTFEVYLQGL